MIFLTVNTHRADLNISFATKIPATTDIIKIENTICI
jgi:hypothetical protein